MAKKYILIDPSYSPPNIAGKSKEIDDLARDKVLTVFDDYTKKRQINAGGLTINTTERWDELYKLYMSIRDDNAQNYHGQANIFVPVTRRAVNVIESEASNALFGRDDYFSIESAGGNQINKFDMRQHAFNVIKYFSDCEYYINTFDIALKQELIYGVTATRVQFKTEYIENIARVLVSDPILDEMTGQPQIDTKTNTPKQRDRIEMHRVITEIKRPYIEPIDIYRLYINPLSNKPEEEDIIYQNELTKNELLIKVEEGIYSKSAVSKLLNEAPLKYISSDNSDSGEGKASLLAIPTEDKDSQVYEVLQFEGLFIKAVQREKEIEVIGTQYFIDIGNRNIVLRCQENPLIGQYKTFSLCNYDSMINEFYTDGVIDPIKGIQYEINDKENQSIDAVSFDLNAPFEVLKSSGITDVDILQIYNIPHKALYVRERDSIRKLQAPVNVQHLSVEITRLLGYVDNVTGSTSLAAGSPTGTQADRSGKALGLLQNQTRSQFSRLIRKFERNIIQATLQKVWAMTMQYSDEKIAMEIENDEDNTKINALISPAEIIGEYVVKVSGGSEYLKQREMRDSMLEFMSILGMNDMFMNQIDPAILKTIAKASPYNMSEFINPDNLYQKQKQQIEQLTNSLNMAGEQMKMYGQEVVRLQGVLKQTDRANETSPPIKPMNETKSK